MKQAFDISYYIQQRDILRNRFKAEKTGDQTFLTEQTKLFQPLLQSQKEIKEKLMENQNTTNNALIPYISEMQKSNNLAEASQYLPFYNAKLEIENVLQSTPKKSRSEGVFIDLDQRLNTTDIENLQDMNLKLPSEVQKEGTFGNALKTAKSIRASIGSNLGKGSKEKHSEKERQVLESRKATLVKYKNLLIHAQIATEEFQVSTKTGTGLLCKPKRNKGRPKIYPDPIIYNNADDLVQKLSEHLTAKQAGNTGLDNIIISMLDELLRINAINKADYDIIYKKYFKFCT